jgi:predicted membrane protein
LVNPLRQIAANLMMIKLKHRKLIFLILIALLAGGSMAAYAESEANFFLKTIELIFFQQVATVVLYLGCFGWDLLPIRPKAEPKLWEQTDSYDG